MGSIIEPYILNLQSISDRLPALAKAAIIARQDEILDLIQKKQLGIGRNSANQPLLHDTGTGFYHENTEYYAEISKPPPRTEKVRGRPYTFQWSGSTFDTMEVNVTSDSAFHIFTNDGKQYFLEGIYGEIFQLTPEHNTWVNENIILPYLYEYLFQNMMKV